MEQNIGFLIGLYSSAVTPFVIADESLSILWRNSPAQAYRLFKGDNIGFLIIDNESKPRQGRVSVRTDDGNSAEFSVIRYTSEDDSILYIVEYLGTDSPCDSPAVRNYIMHMCGTLRHTVCALESAASEINCKIRSGETDVADSLNRINQSSFLLLKEAAVPETMYYSKELGELDSAICVDEEVSLFIEKLRNVLGNETEIRQNSKKNIFTHMHRDVFELIISRMTADCCSRGFYPQKITFSLSNETNQYKRSTLTVKAMGALPKETIPRRLDYIRSNAELFEQRFLKLLHDKYGVTFRMHDCPNSISIVMEFNRCLRKSLLRNRHDFLIREWEYSSAYAVLSELFPREKYKNPPKDTSQ